MKNKLITTATALCLALNACTTMTAAQLERKRLYTDVKGVAGEAQTCYNKLMNNEKYGPLYANFALKRKPATQAELSNGNTVSDEMVILLLDWYATHQNCDNAMLSGFERLDGQLGIVAAKWLKDRAKLLEFAVSTRPTYGKINAEMDVLKIREANEYKEWLVRAEQNFKSRHANEVATKELESQRRQDAMLSTASKVAGALFEVLVDLATVQVALAAAQKQYISTRPVYVPIEPIQPRITRTDCSKNLMGNGFSCSHY